MSRQKGRVEGGSLVEEQAVLKEPSRQFAVSLGGAVVTGVGPQLVAPQWQLAVFIFGVVILVFGLWPNLKRLEQWLAELAGDALSIIFLSASGFLAATLLWLVLSPPNPAELNAKVARAQSLQLALSQYGEAFQRFDNFMRTPHMARVFGGNPQAQVANATDEDFERYSPFALDALKEYDSYVVAVNKSRGPWGATGKINDEIINAGYAARKAMMCYLFFQEWAKSGKPEPLQDKRYAAAQLCKQDDRQRFEFEEHSNTVIQAMTAAANAATP